MSGIQELDQLLASMKPELTADDFIFCTVSGAISDYAHLDPLASFKESEGLTLILSVQAADKAGIEYEGLFKKITLTVHSSLEAVGLTAAVAAKLSSVGISANVVAAYFHDHIFVQASKANEALHALQALSRGE